MCKTGNSYGHPHTEAIEALSDIGAEDLWNGHLRTIIITTNGETYQVQTEK